MPPDSVEFSSGTSLSPQCFVLAVALVQTLKEALTLDAWMSARAALTPWGWCPDKRAPIKLKRWLKALHCSFLSGMEVEDVEECFVIRQVTSGFLCVNMYGLMFSQACPLCKVAWLGQVSCGVVLMMPTG